MGTGAKQGFAGSRGSEGETQAAADEGELVAVLGPRVTRVGEHAHDFVEAVVETGAGVDLAFAAVVTEDTAARENIRSEADFPSLSHRR